VKRRTKETRKQKQTDRQFRRESRTPDQVGQGGSYLPTDIDCTLWLLLLLIPNPHADDSQGNAKVKTRVQYTVIEEKGKLGKKRW
jgi:hypothetical protein